MKIKKNKMKKYVTKLIPVIDILLSPFVLISAIILKCIRRGNVSRFYLAKKIFEKVGVFPLRDHYYEPLFNAKYLTKPLSDKRKLIGINWNVEEQIALLNSFIFQNEFNNISEEFVSDTVFHFKNASFESGDAEYWYNIIRYKKPKKIIEVGSGHSTKIARLAVETNSKLDPTYKCEHICIEP